MGHKSVHVRLGETLKASKGEAVDAATLEFVANQDDWKKRSENFATWAGILRPSIASFQAGAFRRSTGQQNRSPGRLIQQQ